VKRAVALLLTVAAPAAAMIWYRVHDSTGFASVELIAYPLLFGGAAIVLIWFLKTRFLREPIGAYNAGEGGPLGDVGWGIALCAVYFALFFLERATLSEILEFRSNPELLRLMLDMRENPVLMLVWFGPVLWIGIALFEELVWVFLLTELWEFGERGSWKAAVVIAAAILVGVLHWSQGPYGIVTVAIKSVVTGTFYYRKRRLLPLVVAHALYDGLQVGVLLLTL
jgi:membrane protease YdiL (CAAX protease family)